MPGIQTMLLVVAQFCGYAGIFKGQIIPALVHTNEVIQACLARWALQSLAPARPLVASSYLVGIRSNGEAVADPIFVAVAI
ncbi:hypothetical protein TOPH_02143 [Tolypocladium ophioglossoides CBS 100239]|uniref:Uncharacterized protein n=1 Tax=Tolypocladium ophioglossoides (strain CBS 100239) TaxID=1163406 RepID=A0A0L0NGV7_TOLOC|nr:hypothetical protein TOPH_02143 [Tolypocladium ophioglossoides CBS 100239]